MSVEISLQCFLKLFWFQINGFWLRIRSLSLFMALYSFYTTPAKDGADISIALNMCHLCNKIAEVSNMLIFTFVFTFCLIPAPHKQIFKCQQTHSCDINTSRSWQSQVDCSERLPSDALHWFCLCLFSYVPASQCPNHKSSTQSWQPDTERRGHCFI